MQQIPAGKPPIDPPIAYTLLKLWPYIWPSDLPHLKWRVFWALVFLVLAKLSTALVPFFSNL